MNASFVILIDCSKNATWQIPYMFFACFQLDFWECSLRDYIVEGLLDITEQEIHNQH